ncbi:MAG: hypothetical protein Q9166_007540 [cf. Caloplaca sp. 2 TL-2023]
MAPTLQDLPAEILLAIVGYLDSAADYIHLLRSCRSIGRTLEDRKVVAKTIMRVAGYSRECELVTLKAMSANDALNSIYDRQQAISRARPAATIVLGDGQSFLYRQGLVAYVRDDLIRVLGIHTARRTEGVIYTAVVGTQLLGVDCQDSEVELLHLHDGMLTLVYHGKTRTVNWISRVVAIDVTHYELRKDRLLLAVDLWTSEDIVVRNNRQYIAILAPTGLSANGRHREWVCRVWDTDNLPARPPTLQIPQLAVNEIGQALVFEVYDKFLYAVSTQSQEMDEPDWIAHYTCVRFPLDNPHASALETISIWRRSHREGPINDLWTELQLQRDQCTGELVIIEARKEWIHGSSSQYRTWYKQILPASFTVIDDLMNTEDQAAKLFSANASSGTPYLLATPPNDATVPGLDQPPRHTRLPCNTHREYPSTGPSPPSLHNSVLAKSRYRTYIPSAAAFLDIVVDDRQISSPNAWAQQLRVRIGARKEASPLDEQGMIHQRFIPRGGQPVDGSEMRYEDTGIHLWPPADAPAVLQDLLNGSTTFRQLSDDDESKCRTLGDIRAISDERSIVYLIKEKGATDYEKGQLILINFDQHVHFWHKKWVPDFIDLYGQNEPIITSAVCEPANQVAMAGWNEKTYEPDRMEIDESEDECSEEQKEDDNDYGSDYANDNDDDDDDDSWGESQEQKNFQPADDVNDVFWCEEFDEDEPMDMHWFMEQMALWIDFQKGFCFI